LVTLPINKKVLSSSDINFTGHTEFISEICNTLGEEIMLLTNKNLKVALVTTHLALKMVPKSITKKILAKKLQVLNEQLINKFNIKNPRISVTGLNPHAGEDGEFGDEEIKIITPVLKKLKAEGINLIGPIPADTAFTKKYLDKTDCFLAMYHDQGLSAFKALSFGKGINVTIGIPIIRTSVDHGTGLDIVESNKINASSFFESISLAIKLIKK
jgi:4-hydroxythreonine-4-phosphate dehydrogenase